MAPGYYSSQDAMRNVANLIQSTGRTTSKYKIIPFPTPIDENTNFTVAIGQETSPWGEYKYEIWNSKDYKKASYWSDLYSLRIHYGYAKTKEKAKLQAMKKINNLMKPYTKKSSEKFLDKFTHRFLHTFFH